MSANFSYQALQQAIYLVNRFSTYMSKQKTMLRLGIDTGGTFTDFILFTGQTIKSFKIPSTPQAPERAILNGLTQILKELIDDKKVPSFIPELVHGTTVATNALLERKGARTALITTAGFEDVIEIGRQARPEIYNLAVERPTPLVPRDLRFGINERIDAQAKIIEPLKQSEINKLARKLKHAGVESIAISLLFSFANPAHEQSLAFGLASLNLPLSISSELLPEYREYERTSTVVINAYLVPLVSRYLGQLRAELERKLVTTHIRRKNAYSFRIMQSSGGSIAADTAAREPVRTILSGPAGGLVAAMKVAELAGFKDIITFDMGGTSTDVSLSQGAASTTREAKISSLPVAVPVLDIHTVGAGGGSIAEVDAGGALRVGPESAGAMPGPACYGTGTRVTVTDANVVLGRFGGSGLLGGKMELDVNRSAAVIDELAERMSQFASRKVLRDEAARGVIRVANANMERALRLVSVERGHDPRRFSLVSFGGAGGLHAVALAESLRIPRILIPPYPGAFSALGVLLADVIKDYSQTVRLLLQALPDDLKRVALERQLNAKFAELRRAALRDLRQEGFSQQQTNLNYSLAMRYHGQSFELEVPLQPEVENSLKKAVQTFHQLHYGRYGHSDKTRAVEIVSLRLKAIGKTQKPQLPRAKSLTRKEPQPERFTSIWLEKRTAQVPVFNREHLLSGMIIKAPALITEYGSTTLISVGWRAKVDEWRNLIISRDGNQ